MRRATALVAFMLLAVACGDEPLTTTTVGPTTTIEATTTTVPAASTTTTTIAGLPPGTEVPFEAAVIGLEWDGRVTIRTEASGMRVEGVAIMTGAYTAPAAHSVDFSLVTLTIDAPNDVVDREERIWSAVASGGISWLSEDGSDYEADEIGSRDTEDLMEILSTAYGGIIPSPGLLADLSGREWVAAEALGMPVMEFSISGAPMETYGPLFGAGFVDDPVPGVESADLTLQIDPETGAVLSASAYMEGFDGTVPIIVTAGFEVTAMGEAAARVFPPGVEPFDVPAGYDPFVDEAGRFAIGVPAGWDVDDDFEVIAFEGGDDAYAAVLVRAVEPETTIDGFVETLLAEGPDDAVVIERSTVTAGGLDWIRLDAVEADEIRVAVWFTVIDGFGVGFQHAGPAGAWDEGDAEAMFESLQWLGRPSGT